MVLCSASDLYIYMHMYNKNFVLLRVTHDSYACCFERCCAQLVTYTYTCTCIIRTLCCFVLVHVDVCACVYIPFNSRNSTRFLCPLKQAYCTLRLSTCTCVYMQHLRKYIGTLLGYIVVSAWMRVSCCILIKILSVHAESADCTCTFVYIL